MGVGMGTDTESGGKRFEVFVSKNVDEFIGTLLPTIYAGFAVHYETRSRAVAEKPSED
jgi:hypothetical protein